MSQAPQVRLRARYLFTAEGPPLRDAVVVLAGSRTVAIESARTGQPAIDLGNVAILPGFVNAHTHLEFSDLTAPLGSPGIPFADWIRLVVAYRRSRTEAKRQSASLAGLRENSRFGTTSVGEIATVGWPIEAFFPNSDNVPEATVFLEALGLRPERIESAMTAAREHLALAAKHSVRIGISPHAPYSVHPDLVRQLAGLSSVAGVPLAMHLAESSEEMELLQTGEGSLRDLLVEFDAWDPNAIRRQSRPLDYLRILASAHRSLVIHGNYLADDEIAFVSAQSERMALIYCPRTHAYFGRAPYPLAKLLQSGALVALGTDSRASNPDLNLLEEMRTVRACDAVDPQRIVEMATINGAKALGRESEVGSIAPGKRADLAVVRLADVPTDDPYELLFDTGSTVESTIRSGRILAGRVPTS
jgi:cytosine/adenosine deaminase-related metal-dependent hydrolase